VYVWIRCVDRSTMIDTYTMSDKSTLIDTYTMIDPPGWYIHYDWYTLLMHTLWLIHLIDTYTMIDKPDWYTWFNQLYQSKCMYQSGVSVIVYVTIRCISHSVCINQLSQSHWHTWLIHTLWLIHLIDTYTINETPDWYIHYDRCIHHD
jgi:hypothetical protein